MKIIENVQIIITDIYIRYEEEISNHDKFSFGIVLKEIRAETCDLN